MHLPWKGINRSGNAQYGVGYRWLGSSTKELSRAIVCISAIAPCSVCETAVRKTDLHVTQSETAIRLEDPRVIEKVWPGERERERARGRARGEGGQRWQGMKNEQEGEESRYVEGVYTLTKHTQKNRTKHTRITQSTRIQTYTHKTQRFKRRITSRNMRC